MLPSVAARMANRVARATGHSRPLCRVPNVLDVDHVFAVMGRRTPNIAAELRASPTPVFAECVDGRSGDFQHEHLQRSPEPLAAIRRSLNCFPFACLANSDAFDSGVRGYGFAQLLDPARTERSHSRRAEGWRGCKADP